MEAIPICGIQSLFQGDTILINENSANPIVSPSKEFQYLFNGCFIIDTTIINIKQYLILI